jgi:hypothetical protein
MTTAKPAVLGLVEGGRLHVDVTVAAAAAARFGRWPDVHLMALGQQASPNHSTPAAPADQTARSQ